MYIKGLNFLELEKANYFKLVGYEGEGVLWKFYNEDDEPLYVDDDYKILLQEKNILLVKFFVKGRVKIEAYASAIAIIKKAIDLETLLQDKESVIVPSDNIFKELQAMLEAERQQAEYDRLEAERLERERLEAEKAEEEVETEAEPIEAEGDDIEQQEAIEDEEAKAPTEEEPDSVVSIVTTDTEIEEPKAEGEPAEPIEEEVEQEVLEEETEAEPTIVEPELLASLKIEIVVPFGLVSKPSYLCNLFFDTYREFQPLYLEGRLSGADLIVLANRAFITYNILNKGKRLSETLATCMVLAHMISISSNFTSAEGEAGLGGLGFGGISSASLGDVSLSFDSKPIKTMLDSYFSSTPYGLEFLQWYHSRPTLTTIN